MMASKLLGGFITRNALKQFKGVNNKSLVSLSYQSKGLNSRQQFAFGSASDNQISFLFVNKDGKSVEVKAKEGQNILEIAHQNNIDLEGACEMSLACSTCHVILEDNIYDSIDKPTMEEEDLLDLAYGLTDTSRLGCQVKISKLFEGAKITLPKATRNFYVDGHKPKPH